jgi:hypothetical protein
LGLLVLVLLLNGMDLLAESASSKRHDPHLIAPTFAWDVLASVERGGEVPIVLKAIPSYGSQLSFEVTTSPRLGCLSGVTYTSDYSAVVSYQHNGSKAPLDDSFTFRCKAPGHAKSTSYKVQIRITPPPARLTFRPEVLDFGTVFLSESSRTNVTIANEGGVRTRGRIVLPPGFSAPDGDSYNLDEGEAMSIKIEFSPMEEREYGAQAITLPYAEGSAVQLRGKGTSLIEVSKGSKTEWDVKNLSPNPIRVKFEPVGDPGSWQLPSQSTLAGHQGRLFSFYQADHAQDNAVSGPLRVQISAGLSIREIELPPVDPFIPITVRSVTESSLSRIQLGSSVSIAFCLMNRSPYPKHASWRAISHSGGGMDKSESADLGAGETREIRFDWKPSLPGKATLQVHVQEGVRVSGEMSWQATVTSGQGGVGLTVPSMLHESPPSASTAPEVTPLEVEPKRREPRELFPQLEGLQWAIGQALWGQPFLHIEGAGGVRKPDRIRVEERRLILPKGWEPKSNPPLNSSAWPEIQSTNVPVLYEWRPIGTDRFSVAVRGLESGCHELIITQEGASGDPVAQSSLQVVIPPPASGWRGLLALFGLCLLVGLFLLRRVS